MKDLLQKEPVKFALELADIYFSKRVARSAAELAYFLILTFFPILICLNAFIGLLHVDINTLMEAAAPFFPKETVSILADYVSYITTNQSSGLLAAGVVMTLFSSSAAFRALMNIMGEIYERKSYRGVWQIVASVAFSILFLVTIYLSLAVLLTGEWLFQLAEQLFHLNSGTLPWGLAVAALSHPVLPGAPVRDGSLPHVRPPGQAPSPPSDRRGALLRRPGGRLGPVLLVHRHVLPVFPGVRVPGLGHHPAGLALSLR